jgi:hypothetical protein
LDDRSPVTQLLSRARRRSISHLVLDQSALALTIGMGGAILLLLTGTQILEWYWVVLLAVASLGIGLYRLRKTIPSTYRIAQKIDRRLNLADALSTAWHFSKGDAISNGTSHEAVRERQREHAEETARSVNLQVGVPFSRPRFALPAIALAAVAFGLFAVRYAVTGKLDMQQSLVQIALDTFFPEKQLAAKNHRPNNPLKSPDLDTGSPDAPTTQNEENPQSMLDAAQTDPESSNADAMDQSKSAAKQGSQSDQPNADQGNDKGSDKGDKSSNGNEQDSKQGDTKDGKQQNAKDGKQGQGSENSSMLDKLKDAMANMMNKMKSSQKDGQQQQQNAQNGQQQEGKQDKTSKGEKSDNKSESSANSQSDQQSDGADKAQSADAKGQEKGSDKNASPDAKSGIGSADGDKSAKEAAEQAAMGKISEILGKRSANVTGEVMVEVGSSKQQLKTPWAQKQAAHAEAGSEIHRDEVPLMYQPFVQQYFEEIRKAAPAAKAPAKAAPKDPKQGS